MQSSQEDGLITVVADGDVTLSEIREEFQALHGQAPSEGPIRILVQDEGSNFTPRGPESRQLIAILREVFRDREVRFAVMAPSDVHYGAGRVAEVHGERAGIAIRVFRHGKEADALGWLDGE